MAYAVLLSNVQLLTVNVPEKMFEKMRLKDSKFAK